MAATIMEEIGTAPSLGDVARKKPSIGLDIPESAAPRIQEAEDFAMQDSSSASEDIFKQEGLDRESAQKKADIATGLSFGTQIGGAQTGETELVSTDSLIKVISGAGMGLLAGGPMGALAGGLSAGLGAFLSTRASKRQKKEAAAKQARYERAVKQQMAREDKFRERERFDKLEQTGYNRRADKMKQQWDAYKDFNGKVMGMVNNNAALKDRFAKRGF